MSLQSETFLCCPVTIVMIKPDYTIVDNALAPCRAKSSGAMVLNVQDK